MAPTTYTTVNQHDRVKDEKPKIAEVLFIDGGWNRNIVPSKQLIRHRMGTSVPNDASRRFAAIQLAAGIQAWKSVKQTVPLPLRAGRAADGDVDAVPSVLKIRFGVIDMLHGWHSALGAGPRGSHHGTLPVRRLLEDIKHIHRRAALDRGAFGDGGGCRE